MFLRCMLKNKVRNTYARHSRLYSASSLTGAQVARLLLDNAGLEQVKVVQTEGQLTDHYDPRTESVVSLPRSTAIIPGGLGVSLRTRSVMPCSMMATTFLCDSQFHCSTG